MTLELAIPAVRQQTAVTCGPAALLATFRYLGVAGSLTERQLAREVGTSELGTEPEELLEAARRRWAEAELRTGLDLEELRYLVGSGDVVIPTLQAWAERPADWQTRPGWNEDGTPRYEVRCGDGHYVVATSVRKAHVTFMDPSYRGARCRLTFAELASRWHDCDREWTWVEGQALVLKGPAAGPKLRRLGRTVAMG